MAHIHATGFYKVGTAVNIGGLVGRIQPELVKYGLLYNYHVIEDIRGIIPTGWHLPSEVEYLTLATVLGGNDVAGGKMKSIEIPYWDAPNTGADNSSGLNVRGAGFREQGSFIAIENFTRLWTSTTNYAARQAIGLAYNSASITQVSLDLDEGTSILFIKDDAIDPGYLTDYDGNMYPTIKVGNQVWMVNNLIVRHYNNGDRITEVINNAAWWALTTGALCAYNNDWANVYNNACVGRLTAHASSGGRTDGSTVVGGTLTNKGYLQGNIQPELIKYGLLYNYYAVTDVRNIANTGSHVPTDTDRNILITYLGGVGVAGGHLKEDDILYWMIPNTGADNSSGFTARGSGYRDWEDGTFLSLTTVNAFWLSTKVSFDLARVEGCTYLDDDSMDWVYGYYNVKAGLSLSLIKDSTLLVNGQKGTYVGNDGVTYPTICIDTQEWVIGALAETKYRDGSPILEVTNNDEWINLGKTITLATTQNASITSCNMYNAIAIHAQSFTVPNCNIADIQIWTGLQYGLPDFDIRLSIYNVENNLPTTKICDSVNVLRAADLLVGRYETWSFGSYYLPAGTYCFVTSYENVVLHNWDNSIIFRTCSSNEYANNFAYRVGSIWYTSGTIDLIAKIICGKGALCAYNNDWANVYNNTCVGRLTARGSGGGSTSGTTIVGGTLIYHQMVGHIKPAYAIKYGVMYNGYAVTDAKNLANTGWHIATDEDCFDLLLCLDPSSDELTKYSNFIAGGRLKEVGLEHWSSPNTGAINDVGFNARETGQRDNIDGAFDPLGFLLRTTTKLFWWYDWLITWNLWSNDSGFVFNAFTPTYGTGTRVVNDSTSLVHGQKGFYTGNDGRVYDTICIGDQEWLASELAETKYRDGTSIPEVTDNSAWMALDTGALCARDNDWNNVFESFYVQSCFGRLTVQGRFTIIAPLVGKTVISGILNRMRGLIVGVTSVSGTLTGI